MRVGDDEIDAKISQSTYSRNLENVTNVIDLHHINFTLYSIDRTTSIYDKCIQSVMFFSCT